MHLAPINWPFFHVKVERVKGQSSSMAWWWTSCGRHRCIYVYGGRFMVTMVTTLAQSGCQAQFWVSGYHRNIWLWFTPLLMNVRIANASMVRMPVRYLCALRESWSVLLYCVSSCYTCLNLKIISYIISQLVSYVYEKLHTGSETVKSSCCNTLHKVTFSSSKLKKVKVKDHVCVRVW